MCMCIYIYIYMYVYVCVYIYIYIYIYTCRPMGEFAGEFESGNLSRDSLSRAIQRKGKCS